MEEKQVIENRSRSLRKDVFVASFKELFIYTIWKMSCKQKISLASIE